MCHDTFVNQLTSGALSGITLLSQALTCAHRFHLYSLPPFFPDLVHLLEVFLDCSCAMASYMDMGVFVAFLITLLSLPGSSVCARVMGATDAAVAESSYSTIASPMAEYCATDFSQVSYEDVKAACPADAGQGANAACCAAFNSKACQYEAQVNNFGSMCPMLFINYLGAVGPYPAGYFVGPCVDGTKGFCVRQ